NDVDVFICSEFNDVDIDRIPLDLQDYCIAKGLDICSKVKIVHKKSLNIEIIQEQERYLLATYENKNVKYLITGVHLQANPYCNTIDRISLIQSIISDIIEYEDKEFLKNEHRTLVIGDMNASPFDPEMTSKTSFNSVLFKEVIDKSSLVEYQGKLYERFFNPIIGYIGNKNLGHGSFYYSNRVDALYWYCYDQILVRKELIEHVKNLQYLKKIKNNSLIKEIRPNNDISDHLPLLVEIDI
ncbi:MAG: hypothetical protein IKC56_00380, partial [Clostridia bacterium]|nr:hypothetical protein [Clostridia bacterium]